MIKDLFCVPLQGFTGIDSLYESPEASDLVLKTGELTVNECIDQVLELLREQVGITHTHSCAHAHTHCTFIK